jgi:hypothetical protein
VAKQEKPARTSSLDSLDARRLVKQHSTGAIEALVAALRSPGERVGAAVALLNFAVGPPVQHVTVERRDDVPEPAPDAERPAYEVH